MPEELSDELIRNIRHYVKKYNSKIYTANKLGLSYDTVLLYTKDIRIKSRKKDPEYNGIYGKSLDLLKELMLNGYAYSSGNYNIQHYLKLKKYIPQIRRKKLYGKMIYYLDEKSSITLQAFLENSKKKIISYQELKQITNIFDTDLSKDEKYRYIDKSKDSKVKSLEVKNISLAFFLHSEVLSVSLKHFYKNLFYVF